MDTRSMEQITDFVPPSKANKTSSPRFEFLQNLSRWGHHAPAG